jgi:N-acetylglucosaminyl-diphospho-decaprenol L-rhamnosyltransferase
MANPKLSIIIVNYHSSDTLEHCLRSLNVATSVSLEIVLVDNSPAEGTKQVLLASGFHGHYFPQTQNIGFSRAANFGAEHASGEYLCFLHPDTILDSHALDRLVTWVEQHPRTVAGPREKNSAGEIVTTALPFMTRRHIWGAHQRHPDLQWQCRHAHQPFVTPALSGACLLLSRVAWIEVGGWHEELNSFGIEAEWFQRALEYGITARYIPEAVVFHEHTTSALPSGWHRQELIAHDRMWYAKRFGWLAIVGLVAVLWIERKFRLRESN